MSPRRVSLVLLVVLAVAAFWWFRSRPIEPQHPAKSGSEVVRGPAAPGGTAGENVSTSPGGARGVRAAAAAGLPPPSAEELARDYPIAARLNTDRSNIAGDLEILQAVLDAWRSNFPRDGNPVGDNAEITAALAGDNRLGLKLIPPNHPAIDRDGRLCDRWGTPFRFHQLSGQHMELRSAGPDRRFATADDTVLSPPGP